MGVYEEQIVPIKISRLAEYVSRRKRISRDEALVYVYSNPMYDRLYDEGAKWWYLSAEALYDEFESARNAGIRSITNEEFEFYTYCMEKYALAKGLTGLQALAHYRQIASKPVAESEIYVLDIIRNNWKNGQSI